MSKTIKVLYGSTVEYSVSAPYYKEVKGTIQDVVESTSRTVTLTRDDTPCTLNIDTSLGQGVGCTVKNHDEVLTLPYNSQFIVGTQFLLTATIASGYEYVHPIWTIVDGDGNTSEWDSEMYQFSLNSDYTITLGVKKTIQYYDITVTSSDSSMGTASGSERVVENTEHTVTASANSGYHFVNWTENGEEVSSDTSYTFTVTGNRDLVANFEEDAPEEYTITVDVNDSQWGSVTGGGTFIENQNCTVIATPAQNCSFINWTENGNVASTSASYTFTVTGDRNLVANFSYTPATYTISVSANPTNGGTVTGGNTYEQGESCTVTATPEQNYTFTNWTENDNVASTSASYTFTVNANRNLVANFEYHEPQPDEYTITTTVYPTGAGNVTGGGTYQSGAVITLAASANDGYRFLRWADDSSASVTRTITVTSDATYEARFEVIPTYSITINNDGYGYGEASPNPAREGQEVTLTSHPNSNYHFDYWDSSDVTIVDNKFIMPNHTVAINVYFAQNLPDQYTITASASPYSSGSVTGSGAYNSGTTCELTATANTGYTFVNWTENGSQVSTNPSYSFTVNANRTLVANFQINSYTINVSANPSDGGTVTGIGTYDYGQSCEVTAVPEEGYTFTSWMENNIVVSSNASYTFNVETNRTLVVIFSKIEYSININTPTGGTLSTNPSGSSVWGNNIIVTATPETGYELSELYYTYEADDESGEGGEGDPDDESTSTIRIDIDIENKQFTMPKADVTVYAIFSKKTYNVDTSIVGAAGDQSIWILANPNPVEHGSDTTISGALGSSSYTLNKLEENGTEVTSYEIVGGDYQYTAYNVTDNISFVAYYIPQTSSHEVSTNVSPNGAGTITGAGQYNTGATVIITTTANSGYVFDHWEYPSGLTIITAGGGGGNGTAGGSGTGTGNTEPGSTIDTDGGNTSTTGGDGTGSGTSTGTGSGSSSNVSATLEFTMPNNDVTVTAHYNQSSIYWVNSNRESISELEINLAEESAENPIGIQYDNEYFPLNTIATSLNYSDYGRASMLTISQVDGHMTAYEAGYVGLSYTYNGITSSYLWITIPPMIEYQDVTISASSDVEPLNAYLAYTAEFNHDYHSFGPVFDYTNNIISECDRVEIGNNTYATISSNQRNIERTQNNPSNTVTTYSVAYYLYSGNGLSDYEVNDRNSITIEHKPIDNLIITSNWNDENAPDDRQTYQLTVRYNGTDVTSDTSFTANRKETNDGTVVDQYVFTAVCINPGDFVYPTNLPCGKDEDITTFYIFANYNGETGHISITSNAQFINNVTITLNVTNNTLVEPTINATDGTTDYVFTLNSESESGEGEGEGETTDLVYTAEVPTDVELSVVFDFGESSVNMYVTDSQSASVNVVNNSFGVGALSNDVSYNVTIDENESEGPSEEGPGEE